MLIEIKDYMKIVYWLWLYKQTFFKIKCTFSKPFKQYHFFKQNVQVSYDLKIYIHCSISVADCRVNS